MNIIYLCVLSQYVVHFIIREEVTEEMISKMAAD